MLIPTGVTVTPFAAKVRERPADDWYQSACLALRGGDGGEHGQLLYQLIRDRRRRGRAMVALDVGTARGFSAVTMARAMLDSNIDGRVFTVDVVEHDERIDWHAEKHDPGDPLANGPVARSTIWREWAPEEAKITPVVGRSIDVLRDWPHGPVDFAFLDGSHTYGDVKAELDLLDGIMAADGVIVLDDVHFGVVIARVRSRALSVWTWAVTSVLRKVFPKAQFHHARLGVSAEYALVERRFTGIRRALVRFCEEHPQWGLELVPMPRRGSYQTEDYSLAILTRSEAD